MRKVESVLASPLPQKKPLALVFDRSRFNGSKPYEAITTWVETDGEIQRVSEQTHTESSASNGKRLGFIFSHGLEEGLDFRP